MQRRTTKKVYVGGIPIGGGSPIAVQSMNNTDTRDVAASVAQIERLANVGCELTRLAVPDLIAAEALKEICQRSPMPIVADIHFDYRLALAAIEAGVDAIRINPGNIGSNDRLTQITKACKERRIPIRVGVNAGSVRRDLITKYGGVTAEALVHSAKESVALLESCGFDDICISLKASEPLLTVDAYRLLADDSPYPLHVGVTEAGSKTDGIVRSAIGIGILLAEGIGDTLRVSLTDEPEAEIEVCWAILKALNLRERGPRLISCPTCGRTEVGLPEMCERVRRILNDIQEPIRVAVMGCAVNGPGEAREADCGIAGGRGSYVIFRDGQALRTVCEDDALEALKQEIDAAVIRWRKRQKMPLDAIAESTDSDRCSVAEKDE